MVTTGLPDSDTVMGLTHVNARSAFDAGAESRADEAASTPAPRVSVKPRVNIFMRPIRRLPPDPSRLQDSAGQPRRGHRRGGTQMTVPESCCADGEVQGVMDHRGSLVARVLAQRPVLLALARSRSACAADAEDAVQEAFVRALERLDELDPARVEGWMKTVTMNICRDMARERGRHRHRVAYQVRQMLPEPYLDEVVAERAYAADVARCMLQLPAPQRSVLQMRAESLPVEEIASRLGMTHKSAESLLSRGRRTMRAVASSLQAAVVGVSLRPGGRRSIAHTAVGFAASGTLAVAGFVLCGPPPARVPGSAGVTVVRLDVTNLAVASHPLPRSLSRRHVIVQPPPSAQRAEPRSVAHLHAGPVDVRGGDLSRRRTDQTLVRSLQACVSDGVTVSTSYIGCNAAN